MTDEQRELLLKAQQSLEAAKLLLTNHFPDYATSRAYYAMFYIAEAFLEVRDFHFPALLIKGMNFSLTQRRKDALRFEF